MQSEQLVTSYSVWIRVSCHIVPHKACTLFYKPWHLAAVSRPLFTLGMFPRKLSGLVHYEISLFLIMRQKGSSTLLNDLRKFQSKHYHHEIFTPLKHIRYQERSEIGNGWKHFRNEVFRNELFWSPHTMFANSLLLPSSCDCSCKQNSITAIAYHQLKPLFISADTKIQRYKVNVEYLYQVPVWNSMGGIIF